MTHPPEEPCPEQPAPEHLLEACAWLWAAERHLGNTADERDIRARLTAGEALDILTGVTPPYPPPDEDRDPLPLAAAIPHVLAALAAASRATGIRAEERLRLARATRVLTDHRTR